MDFKAAPDAELNSLNANNGDLFDIWKVNQEVNNISLLQSIKSIPNAIHTHLEIRIADSGKEIKGCHNATQWNDNNIVRKESLVTNPSYTVPSGRLLSDPSVPEVVILSDSPLTTSTGTIVLGVRRIEYRVPATSNSGSSAGLTTGALKGGNPFQKTIYDPLIWTPSKLEKAGKEALKDAYSKGNLTIYPSPSVSTKFKGVTSDGYSIEGYFDTNTKEITTFYFK